jgi:hypothetical protein
LCKEFQLDKSGSYTKSLDAKFQEFRNSENKKIRIDWDIWSGFSVTALTSESEGLVNEIGHWLKNNYSK